MVEIALPANSIINKGISHAPNGEIAKARTLKIYRWTPDDA